MDRAPRRSRRLAKQRRRAGKPKDKRMSVGEALGAPAYQVDATNLAEARAMHSARAAAANLSVRKPKRRKGKDKAKSRGRRRYVDPDDGGMPAGKRYPLVYPSRSLSPVRPVKLPGKARSAASSRSAEARRASIRKEQRRESQIRNSIAARQFTRGIFDSGDEPPLPTESDDERKTETEDDEIGDEEHRQWEKEHAARLASAGIIETPAGERAMPRTSDDEFIKGSDESDSEPMPGLDPPESDPDYEITSSHRSSEESDYQRRYALVVRRSIEEVCEDDLPKPKYSDDEAAAAATPKNDPPKKATPKKHTPKSSKPVGVSGKGRGGVNASGHSRLGRSCAPATDVVAPKGDVSPGVAGKKSWPVTGTGELLHSKRAPGMRNHSARVSTSRSRAEASPRKHSSHRNLVPQTRHSHMRPKHKYAEKRRNKRNGVYKQRKNKMGYYIPPPRKGKRATRKKQKQRKKDKQRERYKRRTRRNYYDSSSSSTSRSSTSYSRSSSSGHTTESSARSTPSQGTPSTDPSDSSETETESDSFTSSSDEEAAEELYNRQLRYRQYQGQQRTTVVYTSEDLKKVKSPWLKYGDDSSKRKFREDYLKYCKGHQNVMRGRPMSHRVPPRAVVECIDADLLQYICRFEIAKKYRTSHPENVDALAVHEWAMKTSKSSLDAEDEEGITLIRDLVCNLGGVNGVREVQNLFIQVRRLRKLYRLKTTQRQIITWLAYKIKPPRVRKTVQGILKQTTRRGRRAAKKLKCFHKLLMRVAKTFHESFELGLSEKSGSSSKGGNGGNGNRGRQNSNNNQRQPQNATQNSNQKNGGGGGRNNGRKQNNRHSDNNGKKGPPPDLKCLNCGLNHYVSKCPTIPQDKKKWKFEDWVKFRNSQDGGSAKRRKKKARQNNTVTENSENPSENGPSNESKSDPGNTNPRGGRAASKRALGTVSGVKSGKDGACEQDVDGVVEIEGVSGYYVCDGGCDRATINTAYADKLAEAGIHGYYYGVPEKATLADGSKKAIIVGYLYAAISLKSKAGTVNLNDVRIDIVKGPDKSALLLLGKVEEGRWGLKSYAQQLEEKALAESKKLKTAKVTASTAAPENFPGEFTLEEVKTAYCNGDTEKRRASSAATVSPEDCRTDGSEFLTDGHAFIGEHNWKAGVETKLYCDESLGWSWVTTAAIRGTELFDQIKRSEKHRDTGASGEVRRWMRVERAMQVGELKADIRVVPYSKTWRLCHEAELVRRLTKLKDVKFCVIESDEPAIKLCLSETNQLARRNDEALEVAEEDEDQEAQIDARLQEMLEDAQRAGMSDACLKKAEELVCHKYRDVWRTNLGPKDFVDMAPLEIELNGDFWLPKPYMRRYSKKEMEWWKTTMNKMIKNGIFTRSSAAYVSPSNLVKKAEEGIVKEGKYRMVVDMRNLNKIIKDLHFHLPPLDSIIHMLLGSRCYAKGDGTKGYRQFLTHPNSRKYTGICCPWGNFEHMRVPMGLKIAAAYYQRCMHTILGDLLLECVLQYLDDTLVYAKNEEELINHLDRVFARFEKYNLKLHPGKFVLYATEITWGGKTVDGNGVRPSARRLQAIRDMPEPETLAEMMSFVYGAAWFRGHLMRFAEVAAPLYDLWKDTMAPYEKKTTNRAKRFKLKELPGWSNGGKEAYQGVKDLMADAVSNAYFDPELRLCVFSDASKDFYCMVFTQCKPGDEKLPWDEQAGKHKLLLIVSGRFRHAQLRWHIVEKEAYPFGVRLMEFAHWVNGGKYPAALFTDHKNLLALFDDKARPLACTKPNRERLTRWGISLMALRYEIFHIAGEYNYLADIGSRWGNRHADPSANADKANDGLRGGPKPLMHRLLRRSEASSRKAMIRTKPPLTTKDIAGRDIDLAEGLVLPAPTHLLSRQRIADVQSRYLAEKPASLSLSAEQPQLWQNAEGKVWVPADRQLRKCLYAVAHQGMSGHRGKAVTLAILETRFFWPEMADDVAEFRKGCLQCLKLAEGDMVPRPLASQMIAEYPGEILMMDYIKIGLSRTGYMYVLMLVDKFSRLVEFVPAAAATSVVAARAIVRWSAQRGLPAWIISDGGPHFKNDLIKELNQVLSIEHHITLAYCPWANGSVEVVGKDLLWTLRALCSEFQTSIDEWDLVLPLAEYAINHRRRAILGGRTAVEIMIGRPPVTAVDLVCYSGPNMKEAIEMRLPAERADAYVAKLAASLDQMHEQVRAKGDHDRRVQALREAGRGHAMRFERGDYVMVTAADNQANIKRHAKPMVKWQGPYEVMGLKDGAPDKIIVRLVGQDQVATVSWKRARRIAGPGITITQAVQDAALHDLQKFKVEAFVDWGFADDGTVVLKVRWQGFDESEDTWEALGQLYADVK